MKKNQHIIQELKILGFSENEAQVYLELLGLGQAPASLLARKTGIKRVTVYAVLQTLKEKKVITSIERNKITFFATLDPQRLLERSEEMVREELVKKTVAEKMLPMLQEISGKTMNRPKVQFFEGAQGVLDILEETLNAKSSTKAFITTQNISPRLKTYLKNDYSKQRKKNGIFSQVIAPDSSVVHAYQERDKEDFRETKIAKSSQLLPLDIEIDIFDDKVAFLAVKEEDEIGVLIQNESIARSMEKIFDALWKKL